MPDLPSGEVNFAAMEEDEDDEDDEDGVEDEDEMEHSQCV